MSTASLMTNVVTTSNATKLQGAIVDPSPRHLLADIAEIAHQRGAFLIAEDDRNSCDVLRHENGNGYGIDAAWADDFHHQARVALTGVQESYFKSYSGSAQQIA